MPYLNIYSNCQIVKGKGMSLICDLQMRKYFHIPNDMADVLDYLKNNSIDDCYNTFSIGNKAAIKSYIQFIIKNDLGFIDDAIMAALIDLPMDWDAYSPITNVIIELNENLSYQTPFIKELIQLNLSALEIRCYSDVSLDILDNLLSIVSKSTIVSIKLILKWSSWCTEDVIYKLVDENLRVNGITVHSAPQNKVVNFLKDTVSLVYMQTGIDSCLQCGNIQPGYFITNVELFTESQKHNTCLNRKLAIDKGGNIKNCPSLPASFGHIDTAKLEDVLADTKFSEHWFTKKDDIAVCQDCEFRHVCTDCRAYVEDVNNPLAKPLKCGYDPYANTWEDWTLNPLKQEAIAYYSMETKADQ